jgi:hypothetical protein
MKNIENKNATDNVFHSIRDYGNDPYFVKKANKSKVFLEKNGFPKEIIGNRKNKPNLAR